METKQRTLISVRAVAQCMALLVMIHTQLCLGEYVFPQEAKPTLTGYLTINSTSQAQLFYSYYEATEPTGSLSKTPIILWMQGDPIPEGGPACSALPGMFGELGPWTLSENGTLHRTTAPWNRLFGLLFIDQPVGVGFSAAPSPDVIPTNEHDIARDLYSFLSIFFSTTFKSRPLYLVGEGYAGKYVPALGYFIQNKLYQHYYPKTKSPPFQLKGIAIGNGFVDPIVQVKTIGPMAFAMGLIDYAQQQQLNNLSYQAVAAIKRGDYYNATNARNSLIVMLQNQCGLGTTDDIRRNNAYFTTENLQDYVTPFINNLSVKEAIGANSSITWIGCNEDVSQKLQADNSMSVKWMVDALIPQLPVLLYQGIFDAVNGPASSEAWMRTIKWKGLSAFWASARKLWKDGDVLAGYIRTYENLSHVIFTGAGALVPADQSFFSQQMIENWINGTLSSLAS